MGLKVGNKRIRPSHSDQASISRGPLEATTQTFGQHILLSHGEQTINQLGRFLTDIEQQGQRLLNSRTAKDIQVYKKLVHQFVNLVVDSGLNLQQSRAWEKPRGQIQSVVKQIDSELVELTNNVLNNETQSIDILNKIGEIKGLLINLYQ